MDGHKGRVSSMLFRLDLDQNVHGCIRLDHRRFETANLKNAVLTTQKHYPTIAAKDIAIHSVSNLFNRAQV